MIGGIPFETCHGRRKLFVLGNVDRESAIGICGSDSGRRVTGVFRLRRAAGEDDDEPGTSGERLAMHLQGTARVCTP